MTPEGQRDDEPAATPRSDSNRAHPGHRAALARLADFGAPRGKLVIAGWVVALALAIGIGGQLSGDWEVDYSSPGSGSERAATLMAERFGDAGSGDTVAVVWEAPGGF